MGYNFPWTNLHDLNLDWIMRQLKRIDELQSTVNHFIQQIPTRLSQLVNDTGFINAAQAAAAAPVQSVNEHIGDVTFTDIMTRRANQATAYPTTSGAWSVASNIFSNLTAASYYGVLTIENNGSYQRHIFNNMSGQVFVGWTDNVNITEPATWASLAETSEDLYFCTYNTTTNAQIESALSANKIPVLLYSDTLYVFSRRVSANNHYFCAVHSTSSSSNYYYARCNSNAWSSGSGTLARLTSPTFTGTPKAPTPATTDNSTQIATTAYVKAQNYVDAAGAAAAAPVQSVNGKTGAVTIGDIMQRASNAATTYPTAAGAYSVTSNIFSNLTASGYYGILTIETNAAYQRHMFTNNKGEMFVGWRDASTIAEPAEWEILPHNWKQLTGTYSAQSYVTEADFNKIFAYSDGRGVYFYFNLNVTSSPGGTFRTIGSFALPKTLPRSLNLTVASQNDNGNLTISVLTNGTVQIYSYGTAAGYYRVTGFMPF